MTKVCVGSTTYVAPATGPVDGSAAASGACWASAPAAARARPSGKAIVVFTAMWATRKPGRRCASGHRRRVEQHQRVVQLPVLGPGLLPAAGDVEHQAEQLP